MYAASHCWCQNDGIEGCVDIFDCGVAVLWVTAGEDQDVLVQHGWRSKKGAAALVGRDGRIRKVSLPFSRLSGE